MDKHLLLILVITVISSHGYSIKQPGALTASFSGSSSSSSAFSQSSSSAFSINGNVNPNDADGLKLALNTGAIAGASATANAAVGAASGSLVNAGAAAIAGSTSVGGAEAGIDAIGSQKCSGGCGNAIEGSAHSAAADSGSYKVIDSDKYTTGYSSGSAAESAQANSGSYKIINGDKFNAGFSGADKTNYAVSSNYANANSNTVSCSTCKGPFPGPSGSIHDYKPATSGTTRPNSYQPQPAHPSPVPVPQQPIQPISYQPIQPISQPIHPVVELEPPKNSYQQPIIGDIYTSKPVTSSGGSYTSGSGSSSGHISAGLISSLPGAPGSIHASKPASAAFAGASATVAAGASASSTINSGGLHTPAPVNPVPFKAPCQNSGSSDCVTPNYAPVKPIGSGLSGIIPVLPGPSGSIYDSKPVGAVAVAGSVSGSQSGSYSGSGNIISTGIAHQPVKEEVINIPLSHPVNGPACAYSGSGSNSKCAPAISQEGAVSYQQPHTTGGSVQIINIPSTHPIEGPACGYNPGSSSKCAPLVSQEGSISGHPVPISHTIQPVSSGSYSGSETISNTVSGSNSQTVSQSANSVGSGYSQFPGPSGSIYDSKPASFVSPTFQSGIGANLPPVEPSSVLSAINKFSDHTHKPVYQSPTPFSTSSDHNIGNNEYDQFSGHNEFTNNDQPVSSPSSSTFVNMNTQPTIAPGSTFFIGSLPGSSGSIHQSKPVFSSSLETPTSLINVEAPSIHPETPTGTILVQPNAHPSGTYFINKQPNSHGVETTLTSGSPSFSGQIPCADNSCGNIEPSISGTISGSSSGSYSASGSQTTSGSGVVYVDKDTSGQYQVPSHEQAHESGGIVYQNEDGSYSHNNQASHKNSANGQYAVSSNTDDNTGVLIGPGTGNLPVEADKPFGTQGFGGGSQSVSKQSSASGSAAYEKENHGTIIKGVEDEKNKPFGTQGFGGGSAAFSKSSASASAGASAIAGAQGSEIHPSTAKAGVASGSVLIQKSEGTDLASVEAERISGHYSGFNNVDSASNFNVASGVSTNVINLEKPCTSGLCETGNNIVFAPQTGSDVYKNQGTPVKVPCISGGCQNTEVFIIEEQPQRVSYGSYGTGSKTGSGFATGQVLVNQGVNTYDVTNSGSKNGFNYNSYGYHGNQGGDYASGNNYYGYSGCSTGRCGGNSFGYSKTISIPSHGGLFNKLFGAGGLSGAQYKFGGGSSGSRSFANAGSYSSASSGSFASAGASAQAASYASTY